MELDRLTVAGLRCEYFDESRRDEGFPGPRGSVQDDLALLEEHLAHGDEEVVVAEQEVVRERNKGCVVGYRTRGAVGRVGGGACAEEFFEDVAPPERVGG